MKVVFFHHTLHWCSSQNATCLYLSHSIKYGVERNHNSTSGRNWCEPNLSCCTNAWFNTLLQQCLTNILVIHIKSERGIHRVRVFDSTDSARQITSNRRSEIYWVHFQKQTSRPLQNWVMGDMSPYLDLIARKTHFTVYPSDKAYSHTSTFQIGSAGIHFWRLDVITLTS